MDQEQNIWPVFQYFSVQYYFISWSLLSSQYFNNTSVITTNNTKSCLFCQKYRQ